MKMILRLAWVIIRGNGFTNLAGDANQKKRRLRGVGSVILLSCLTIYMATLVAGSAYALIDVLRPAHLEVLLIGLYVSAGVILTFFVGNMYAVSIYYYASDVDKLMPLPLRPEQILGAKFLVTLLYEYMFIVIIIVPPLLVYGIRTAAGPGYFLVLLFSYLLLPIIPLCLATILIMLVMRFTPFARNKDRFNMVASLLLMALALAFTFGTQSLARLSNPDLSQMIGGAAEKLAGTTANIFPGTSLVVAALAATSPARAWLNLGFLFLLAAAALALVLLAGRLLYFQGATGLSTSYSRRRKLPVRKLSLQAGPFWSYVRKDTLVLFRTPIFFLNNVLMNFLWPAFIIPAFIGAEKGSALTSCATWSAP